jgi:SAM-dependent methyltransferase
VRLTDPTEGLKGTELERVAIEGDSIADQRAFWDRSAEVDAVRAIADRDSDETFEVSGEREARQLAPFIRPESRVLEIGCGAGRILRHVAVLAADVHGVDISPRMVEEGRRRLGDLDHVSFHVGNGYDLADFEDGSFDVVYSVVALQHMPKTVALNYFKEAHRVLRPEGVFWFHVPNVLVDDYLHALNHFSQPYFAEHPYPMNFWTPLEVDRVLTYVHFRVDSMTSRMVVVARKTEQPPLSDEVIAALPAMTFGLAGVPFDGREVSPPDDAGGTPSPGPRGAGAAGPSRSATSRWRRPRRGTGGGR